MKKEFLSFESALMKEWGRLVGEAHAFTIGKIDSILWFNTLNIHNFATHPLKPLHISLSPSLV